MSTTKRPEDEVEEVEPIINDPPPPPDPLADPEPLEEPTDPKPIG
jgi:hypothetical protein